MLELPLENSDLLIKKECYIISYVFDLPGKLTQYINRADASIFMEIRYVGKGKVVRFYPILVTVFG